MDKTMTDEAYEGLKARKAAFNSALQESNKWAALAKPIQHKQVSQTQGSKSQPLTPSEQLIKQSAVLATEKLSHAMEQYLEGMV